MSPDDIMPNNSTTDVSEIQEISRYFSLLWRWAWLILLLGCVAAGIAYFISQQMTPVYETSTSLLVLNAPYNTDQYYSSIQASQSLASTYANILGQDALLGEVISRLGLSTTPEDLSKSIKITPRPSTQMVIITVKGTDRTLSTNIANTLVTVFIERMMSTQIERYTSSMENLQKELENVDALIESTSAEKESTQDQAKKDELEAKLVQYRQMYSNLLANYEETRLAEIQSTSNVVQISPAGLSYTLATPKVLIITLLAGVMAMLLATGFVVIRDALDHTLKTPEEITQKLKLPVVGVIFRHEANGPPITQFKPGSSTAEAFRLLSTKIQYADSKNPVRSIIVTSPTKSEGKSIVSVNLALALAQAGNSVTLIDSNFSRPVIHDRLQLSNDVGLAELLLQGQTGLSKKGILQKVPNENLSVISSGANSSEESNVIVSKNFVDILDALTDENKLVVIDTAPVLNLADTVILSTLVDGLLLVVQAGKTTLAEAKQAVDSLHWVNARIVGVVLNNYDIKTFSHKS